jgi:hypothetical protein
MFSPPIGDGVQGGLFGAASEYAWFIKRDRVLVYASTAQSFQLFTTLKLTGPTPSSTLDVVGVCELQVASRSYLLISSKRPASIGHGASYHLHLLDIRRPSQPLAMLTMPNEITAMQTLKPITVRDSIYNVEGKRKKERKKEKKKRLFLGQKSLLQRGQRSK